VVKVTLQKEAPVSIGQETELALEPLGSMTKRKAAAAPVNKIINYFCSSV
jgi:hypothetical protein